MVAGSNKGFSLPETFPAGTRDVKLNAHQLLFSSWSLFLPGEVACFYTAMS